MAIPTKIKQLAQDIRMKIYGEDVRESLAKGIEETGDIADVSKKLSENTQNKQNILESKYNNQIAKATDITEIKDFHVSGVTGETFETMGKRADYFDSLLINNQNEFKQRGVNILWFKHLAIERTGGGYDWTPAIQKAIDELEEGTELFIPNGYYYFSNIVIEKDDITINCMGSLVQFATATGTAVKIGSNSKRNFRAKGNLNISKQNRNWSQDNIGVEIINMNEATLNLNVREFTVNILLVGDNQGTSYNTLFIQRSVNGQKNLAFKKLGTGWVNENRIFGGRMTWDTDVTELDRYHIYIPERTMNNNSFYSLSMEGFGGTFVYNNGRYNHFYTPRLEGSALKLHFGPDSIYNTVHYPYDFHTIEGNTGEYKDEGSRNHIYGRDEIVFDRTHITAGSIKSLYSPGVSETAGDAGHSVQTTTSSAHKAYQAKSSVGEETFHVLGNGSVKAKSIELDNGILWNQVGVLGGNHVPLVSNEYTTAGIKIVALKTTVGAPTASTPPQGTGVLNTADSKLYLHFGGGIWKGIQLS